MITVSTSVLSPVLEFVSKFTYRKSSIAALSGIKLSVEGNILTAETTNLNSGAKMQVPCIASLDLGLETCIVPLTLVDLIKNLKCDSVDIRVDDGKLIVKSEKSKTGLALIGDDFPAMNNEQIQSTFEIPSDLLQEAIENTVPILSKGDARPFTTGVFMSEKNGKLVFVATDTSRLTAFQTDIPVEPFGCVVPGEFLREFKGFMEPGMTKVSVGKRISFQNERGEIYSRTIDASYPKWEQVIPASSKIAAIFDPDELSQALKRAVLTNDSVVFEIGEQISLFARAETGEHNETLQGHVLGGSIKISFNGRFLLDAIRNAKDDVTFSLNEPRMPVLITYDDRIKAVVMPTLAQ